MDLQYNDSLQKVEDPLAPEDVINLEYIGIKDNDHLEEYVVQLDPKPPEEGLIELVMDLDERYLKDNTNIEELVIDLDPKPIQEIVGKKDPNKIRKKHYFPQGHNEYEENYFIIQIKDVFHCPTCDFANKQLFIIKEHIKNQHKRKNYSKYSSKSLLKPNIGESKLVWEQTNAFTGIKGAYQGYKQKDIKLKSAFHDPANKIEIETTDMKLEMAETKVSVNVVSQGTKLTDIKKSIIKPEGKVMCTQCGFKGLDDLGMTMEDFDDHRKKVHKKEAKTKMYFCPRHLCGKIFTTRGSLLVHTKDKHSRKNNHATSKKKIIKKFNTTAEQDYGTLNEKTGIILPITTIKRGRPVGSKHAKHMCTCSICTNKRNNVEELAGNSHKCNKCDKIINKWCNFQAHMRSHEGIRPYACMVQNCSSAFIRSADLERHMKCHSSIVRFTCHGVKCGKTFIRTDKYKQHMKKCNNIVRNIWKCGKASTPISGNLCCKECDKSFQDIDSLKNHNEEHHKIQQHIEGKFL